MPNEGVNRLARVIHARTQAHQDAHSELVLDFGVINADYSLLTDTYPVSIPKSDYLVLRQLTLGDTTDLLVRTGITQSHQHTVPVPSNMRSIKPGDRVLVAWVHHDAVVLDIILPASILE